MIPGALLCCRIQTEPLSMEASFVLGPLALASSARTWSLCEWPLSEGGRCPPSADPIFGASVGVVSTFVLWFGAVRVNCVTPWRTPQAVEHVVALCL